MSLMGDDRKAYEIFKDGIRRDEFDKELQLAAGKSALKLGLPEEAETHLKEALAWIPNTSMRLLRWPLCIMKGRRSEELVDLLSYSKEDYGDIPLLNAFLAYAYEREEQYEDAYVSYRKAYGGMKDDHGFLGKIRELSARRRKTGRSGRNSQGIGQTCSR